MKRNKKQNPLVSPLTRFEEGMLKELSKFKKQANALKKILNDI